MPVYAKPLTLNKGVDNQIQFQFLNQEQKPVDITGKTITCRVLNNAGTEILLQKTLTLQYATNGIAALIVNASEIENIIAQKGFYSLEIPVNEFDYPVFVDQNAGARGDMNIVNSVLPSFVPSESVSIPTGQPFPNLDINNNINNVLPNSTTYYSSIINTYNNPLLTIQATLHEYNGDVVIEGTTNQQGTDWYPIQLHAYYNETDTLGWTIRGYHPYVRLSFTSNTGEVSHILTR